MKILLLTLLLVINFGTLCASEGSERDAKAPRLVSSSSAAQPKGQTSLLLDIPTDILTSIIDFLPSSAEPAFSLTHRRFAQIIIDTRHTRDAKIKGRQLNDDSIPIINQHKLVHVYIAFRPAILLINRLTSPLIYLGCASSGISDADIARLDARLKVKTINLWACKEVTDAALSSIGMFPLLEDLNFQETSIMGSGLGSISGLANLQSLNLGGSPVTNAHLASIVGLKNLRFLGLNNCGNITSVCLDTICQLPQLRKLMLGLTKITNQGLGDLAQLKYLTYLDISNTPVKDDGINAICDITSLEGLNLSGLGPISDNTMQKLGTNLTKLRALCLVDDKVTDQGFAHLQTLKSLVELNLMSTGITDEGVVHLQKLQALQRMYLGRNPITNKAMQTLAQMPSLKIITLGGNRAITNEGMQAIRGMPNLTEINIAGTAVSVDSNFFVSKPRVERR